MKKNKLQWIFVCSAFLIVLVIYGSIYAAEPPDVDELLEQVTGSQNDPFKAVRPAEAETDDTLMNKLFSANRAGGDEDFVEEIPDRFMGTVMLKFLTAENVALAVGNMLTSYGAISTDAETNTIIICDTRENLDKMVTEIRKADQTPKQVLVEVVIMDVQLHDETEIGVNWADLVSSDSGHTAGYGQRLRTPNISSTAIGGTFTLFEGNIKMMVNALQQVRDTEILSAPRLLVVSGQTASLETIEEIPYTELSETGGGGAGGSGDNSSAITSTEFKEAGISLTVSPIITDEGRILIAIAPDQSFNTGVLGLGDRVPIIDRRKVSTTLLMDDGQVLVIGGLRRKDVQINHTKVPILGDLPLIGGLFSNDKKVIEHSELLILVSAHIYDGQIPLKEDEAARWKEANSLDPVRLKQKIRPEYKAIAETLPQIKAQVQ